MAPSDRVPDARRAGAVGPRYEASRFEAGLRLRCRFVRSTDSLRPVDFRFAQLAFPVHRLGLPDLVGEAPQAPGFGPGRTRQENGFGGGVVPSEKLLHPAGGSTIGA